ncbi:MAG: glycosyl transferase [Bacteroidetes bacterium]|nr:MAG: glycosyl transferase [Bacteroidota bacterium]
MKIFYAVQATGNGHISRATQLLPYLQQFGTVDIFLSGSNASLSSNLPATYKSKGMSLFYSPGGGLDYARMWRQNSLLRALREAKQLPLENYDIIINDFEFVTAQACRMKGLPSVQFGHQASFMSPHAPRPAKRQLLGEWLLKKYAPASHYVGLHFCAYDSFIFPPVIKDEFVQANPTDGGHITVYLAAYERHRLEPHFKALPHLQFHWFLPGLSAASTSGNISYFPVSQAAFNQSLIHCHGIITGAGFETPAEALYLKKRIMCIPIRGQYEQLCNAAALAQMGVAILSDANTPQFANQIAAWRNAPQPSVVQAANNIPQTLAYLMQQGRTKA